MILIFNLNLFLFSFYIIYNNIIMSLNKVNNEIISKPISDDKLKDQILKIDFDDFLVEAKYAITLLKNFSRGHIENGTLIESKFSKEFNNKIIEYFYIPNFKDKLYENTPFERSVNDYFTNLRQKLNNALNVPKIIKGFNNYIHVLDGVTDPKAKSKLPRFLKMQRLIRLYESLVEIGLTLIHDYYWENIVQNQKSLLSLKECIKLASPTIIDLKHRFEDLVNEEFEYDADEEKLIMTGRIYKK
jgi:hypothetical protein